jgi:5-hydroxyisourate hydrolase
MASLSTHVLDTEAGEPAAGVKVALYDGKELISLQETGADGRIGDLAEIHRPGEYRLVFYLGGFFDQVELTLSIVDVDRHYHVPLLVSAFSCTTYLGS